MKTAALFLLLALSACNARPKEQEAIIAFMKENANDPASYEPISFRFIGPATYDNTGVVSGSDTRCGDLYEHTFRAKNGFGALMMATKVFAIDHGSVEALPDSLGDRAIGRFHP